MKSRLSAQQGFYTSLFFGLLEPDPFIKKARLRRHLWEYEKLHLFAEPLTIIQGLQKQQQFTEELVILFCRILRGGENYFSLFTGRSLFPCPI